MSKKIGVIIVLFVTIFSLPSLVFGEDVVVDEFIEYRKNLIKYQPEFTVEGLKMITRQQATNHTKAEIDKEFFVCSSEELKNRWFETGDIYYDCGRIPNEYSIQHFQRGDFDWYIWHEQIYEYSRFAQVKTRIAKFPINENMSQQSYALFSYQGYWYPQKIEIAENKIVVDFYYLALSSGERGPDYIRTIMFFNPDVDYPLFFTSDVNSRYGFGATRFYYDGENIIRTHNTDYSGDIEISYKRSLNNGQKLLVSELTVEEVQEYETIIIN